MAPDDADARIARLSRAIDGSHDGFWEDDLRHGASWYSPSLRALLGLADGELPDALHALDARIHPDDVDAFFGERRQAQDTLTPFGFELRLRDGRGQWRWVRGRASIWPGDDGDAALLAGAVSDVHEEKHALLALERMSERFDHAAAAAEVGLFERDVGTDEVWVADGLARLLGYEPGKLSTSRTALLGLIHADDLPGYVRDVAASLTSMTRLATLCRIRHRSGDYRWFRQQSQPTRLPDGGLRITGVLVDVHDQIVARQALEHHREALEAQVLERTARLQAALAQAEQRGAEAARANAATSRFLAHMSHEIRTPLNGLLGLTELALRVASEPAQLRYLELALQSGQTLRRIIDQVLETARLEGGMPAAVDEPFDLADALADTYRGVMPLARHKTLALRYDYASVITRVRGDPSRLRQIVTNLLGNAVKFTERGHVALTTDVQPDPAVPGRLWATMRVEDTGPGIAPALRDSVFDAFVQGDASLSRRHGGTGLGLTIARGLAREMGGDITVGTAAGGGALFTLELPLGAAPAAPPPPAPPGRAWVVSPQPDGAVWLARRFARVGWPVRGMQTIDEALTAAADEPLDQHPPLVLLPEWSLGTAEALAALRHAMPHSHIALLVRPDWHEPAVEALARSFDLQLVVTPLTPHDLLMLAGADRRGAAAPAAARPAVPPAGHVLVVEDNPVNRLIAEEFLAALGLAVRTAENGAQAVDACRRDAPRLVLMDLQMPVMDGLEATRQLRALQREGALAPFPIVALTAHALASDREQAVQAGMDGYLTKPILLEALRAEVGRWLPGVAADATAA